MDRRVIGLLSRLVALVGLIAVACGSAEEPSAPTAQPTAAPATPTTAPAAQPTAAPAQPTPTAAAPVGQPTAAPGQPTATAAPRPTATPVPMGQPTPVPPPPTPQPRLGKYGGVLRYGMAPNSIQPVIVQATLGMGFAILGEASLSFIGIGVTPPTPTWGNMLNMAFQNLNSAPWLSFAPGITIFLLVLSFNFVGDGLRDVLDPRLRGRI